MPAPDKVTAERRDRIAYFVSAHGFGHAARATAVMAAVQQRAPGIAFHIFTQAPAWFFADSLTGPHRCHPMDTDVGLVQRSPLEEDLPETLARLDARFPIRPARLAEACRLVTACECRLIVCDIAALGIAAATALGIPSILVENFTWDWIYEQYPRAPEGFKAHARYQAERFSQARFRIQTEPVCNPLPVDLKVPPICRAATADPARTRRRLGVRPGTPLVMVTMGGTPATYAFLQQLSRQPRIQFLLPGVGSELRHEGNRIMLPARSRFRHPDLIEAADAVVGKVGYSTIAEVYHAGVPFGFVRRPDFPESPPLASYIRSHMPSLEMDAEGFQSGRWIDRLPTLLALPRRRPQQPNGAEAVADFVLSRLQADAGPSTAAKPL